MDGFWSSRCLNDHTDLPNKIGLFLSGATTPMVVKNGTNKILSCLQFWHMKSEIIDGFWSSGCLNDRNDVPNKIGLFLSGTTTPMVVKNGTKNDFMTSILAHEICKNGQIF